VDKPHVPKRQLDSVSSRRHVELGNNPLNPLRRFQEGWLELVEPRNYGSVLAVTEPFMPTAKSRRSLLLQSSNNSIMLVLLAGWVV